MNETEDRQRGLYRPEYEHDACGVGLVASLDNLPSHAIVESGLTVLKRLMHRGATGNDPRTGDGAGLLLRIPDPFFRKVVPGLPPAGQYGVAMVFGGVGEEDVLESVVHAEGGRVLAWRDVPVDPNAIGDDARRVLPKIRELFIGGADGPTAIFLTTKLAPHLLGPIAIAAYSYMALIPLIQPPLMKLCTTKEMREVKMEQAREVSKTEKIIFPIVVATFVILLLPSTAPLIGCLMLGNLFRECGVTDRLSDTAQNALMNIVTIFLATSVGATMVAQNFLSGATIKIIILGLCAFAISTIGGLFGGVVMYYASGKKINPLIGSAGVSAVPMAARVSQDVGRKYNKTNFLLMHAMGPNVAGVIGSAIAAGFLLSVFGG